MTHSNIYNVFAKLFPSHVNENTIYFQNGKDSIRLRGIDGFCYNHVDFVFTYTNPHDWRFETIDSFIERTMKGDKIK